MRKLTLPLVILFVLNMISLQAFPNQVEKENQPATSIGMVIYSNDVETVWNVFRLANHSKNQGDTVQVFLLAKGVEADQLVEVNADIKEQVDSFLENGGTIMGCGTCLQSRKNDEPQICTFSSMADLYKLVRKNEIVLTF